MESIIERESKGADGPVCARVCEEGGERVARGRRNEEPASSAANGRKWTLVREEYAEREKTGRGNERTDRDTEAT